MGTDITLQYTIALQSQIFEVDLKTETKWFSKSHLITDKILKKKKTTFLNTHFITIFILVFGFLF